MSGQDNQPVKLLLVRPELGQGRQVEDLGARWPWVVMTWKIPLRNSAAIQCLACASSVSDRTSETSCVMFTSLYTWFLASFSRQGAGLKSLRHAELVSGKPETNHLPLNPQPLIVTPYTSSTNSPAMVWSSHPWTVTLLPVSVWTLLQSEFPSGFSRPTFGAHSTKLSRYLGDLGPICVFNMSQPLYAVVGTESRALCLLVKRFPTELKPSPLCQLMI